MRFPVALVVSVFLGGVFFVSTTIHAVLHQQVSWWYLATNFFLILNILICYWEMCLFKHADYVSDHASALMDAHSHEKGKPVMAFLFDKISMKDVLSMKYWSQLWGVYALFDGSYADRRTFGFNVDIGNGMFSILPSLFIHLALTWHVFPAVVVGIVALCVFYQVTYCTFMYWVSFFQVGRHKHISFQEQCIYIWGTNAPWFIFGLIGVYVSIRLILDNNYLVVITG